MADSCHDLDDALTRKMACCSVGYSRDDEKNGCGFDHDVVKCGSYVSTDSRAKVGGCEITTCVLKYDLLKFWHV